jgi:hypothetical protein
MVMVDLRRYGCAAAKDRGTCSSSLKVSRKAADDAVLGDVRARLRDPEAFRLFQQAVAAELKRQAPVGESAQRKLQQAEKVRENILAALRAGIITPSTKTELEAAEAACSEAQALVAQAKAHNPARILPRLREVWDGLLATLSDRSRSVPQLRDTLRAIIGEDLRVLRNENGDPVAEVAAEINVVAGAGFRIYLTPAQIPLYRAA